MTARWATTLAITFIPLTVQPASAAWQWPDIKEMCSHFLEQLRPIGDITGTEIRRDYNLRSLRYGHARMVSATRVPLRLEEDQHIDWIMSVMRASVEITIARFIPDWKADGYWYFQTVHDINLYTENSRHPVRFDKDSVVLMNGEYAAGEVLDAWNRVELYP